jgi:ABC-type transport system substrate-binding protein
MATDRHTLANIINRGLVAPATGGFLSPAHAAYTEGIGLPFDPDRARQLLAEAGFAGGHGLPVITMVSGHASLSVEANLRFLQSQWRQELGVDLRWETIWEMAPFLRRLRDDPPHLFFIRWAGKHPDPDDFLHRESALVWEVARWHAPHYFDLLQQARTLTDWGQRMALYRQADKELIDEAVVLPLVYDRSHFLVKPWVRRLSIPAYPRWFFSEVYLTQH